ncbi:OmpA family protein [Rubrivirga sp.]|uniref:OmpA family protein n=1 Tax=Rubrivirga sp. TaxID=1885344 RepID=UPI003B528ABC
MIRRLALTLALAGPLVGCGSSAPSSTPPAARADAAAAVDEARRAIDRAEADSMQAAYLDAPRRAAQEAAAALAAGDGDLATHQAYLARQGARLAALQAEIDAAEQAVRETDEQGGRRLLITDAFQTARVTLKPESSTAVDRVAAYLVEHPDRAVLVESFTDATGNADRNFELSVRRAEAVKARLVEAGVAEDRVVTAGYGQAYPVASNDTAADQRLNRRIEITVAPSVDDLQMREPPTTGGD